MLLTHARVKHLSFPTARYFSTAARAPPRVRERAWRHAWGRWPAADVGRRARARPAWHDDVEGLLCFWWCACRRTTGVSRPLSRRRDRAAAANEEPTRKPVAGLLYVVARTQYKEDSRPSRVCTRRPQRSRGGRSPESGDRCCSPLMWYVRTWHAVAVGRHTGARSEYLSTPFGNH